ncbi:TetR-like C-terminal domain-containing protein [Streptomyces sp. Ru87]|uniref:TetR-like C-terminal domain-containing protein n=1 Tax=Streptomyces sp. Ru87 TaxID=2044307 RepID=UPI0034D30864
MREDAEPDLVIELLYGPVYHRWLLTGRVLDERRIAAVVGTVVTGLEPKPPAT